MRPVARLDRRIVSVWRWTTFLTGIPLVLAGALPLWFFVLRDHSLLLTLAAVLLGLALLGIVAAALPPAMWRHWSFVIGPESFELSRGIFFREHAVVPWSRVQHVDIKHGPLDRRFGLARLQVHTASASTDADLPGLAAEEAEQLRLEIIDRYRAAAIG